MIIGFIAIGYFIATDLDLDKEIQLAKLFKKQHLTITPDSSYFPLAGKFILFASLSRSEERREGKSVDLGGRRIIKKKKQKSQCRTRRESRTIGE